MGRLTDNPIDNIRPLTLFAGGTGAVPPWSAHTWIGPLKVERILVAAHGSCPEEAARNLALKLEEVDVN